MPVALLIALLAGIALGVYALRVAAERDRLRDDVQLHKALLRMQQDSPAADVARRAVESNLVRKDDVYVVQVGQGFTNESARQRQKRAEAVIKAARESGDWRPLLKQPKAKRRK